MTQIIDQYNTAEKMLKHQFKLLEENTKYFDIIEKEKNDYIKEIKKLNEKIKVLKGTENKYSQRDNKAGSKHSRSEEPSYKTEKAEKVKKIKLQEKKIK